jgi:hypothetical protein
MDRPGEELQQQMEEAGEEWTDGRTGAQTGGQYDRSRRADRGKTQRDGEEEGEMELHGRTPDTRANTRADIEERWTDRDQDEMGALRYGRELRERTDGRDQKHSRGDGKRQRRENSRPQIDGRREMEIDGEGQN